MHDFQFLLYITTTTKFHWLSVNIYAHCLLVSLSFILSSTTITTCISITILVAFLYFFCLYFYSNGGLWIHVVNLSLVTIALLILYSFIYPHSIGVTVYAVVLDADNFPQRTIKKYLFITEYFLVVKHFLSI